MRSFLVVPVVVVLVGCAPTKFLPEDACLLNRVGVTVDDKEADINLGKMKSYVRQRSNSRWFSAFKIPLSIYSLSGKDSTKWMNKVLQAMGEAPVVYDSALTQKTCQNLTMELQNEGFLHATVDVETKTRNRKVNTTYRLHPGRRYYMRNISYDIKDSVIASILRLDLPQNQKLKPGKRFNVNVLDEERKRITALLTNRGYYKFHKDFISFRADSVVGSPEVDVTLVLHLYRTSKTPESLHTCYGINSINYASGDINDSSIHIRPSVLLHSTMLEAGRPYSALKLRETYNRFGRLQAVKYTNITFRECPDTTLLDCDIQVSTHKPSTISFQPEGTNTAGDLGAAASLTYQNRNMFRGSEVFSMELRGAFEAIKGLEGYSNENFIEYSAEGKLMFPRFIAPLLPRNFKRRVNATSEVSLLYDLQNRPEYHRRVLSLAWRYKWNDIYHHDRYQVDLLQLNYVFMPWISDKFRNDYLGDTSNRNAILRYNYEDLFIMKFGFGFSYNNGDHAVKANIETAGNLLGLCSGMMNFEKNSLGQNMLFNIAYAQYVKADFDFTKNFVIDYNNTLVLHAGFGMAYPYGNSTILPFEKRYFSGGANSVRGWSVRGLGPGKFIGRDGNIDFINQTGDMKLDINMEYRARLFWKLGGAVFVDAGNIWTIRNYEDQPGGQFRMDEFWRQIAVAYGVGFRLNFDYFILRFDMGMKAINPAYESGDLHYPIIHPSFSRDFTFHFAVGMPF